MNKKHLVKILNQELTTLADFINGFNDSENIHPMEVDLALSKVKDIYNELLLLKDAESTPESDISKTNKTVNADFLTTQTGNLQGSEAIPPEEEVEVYSQPEEVSLPETEEQEESIQESAEQEEEVTVSETDFSEEEITPVVVDEKKPEPAELEIDESPKSEEKIESEEIVSVAQEPQVHETVEVVPEKVDMKPTEENTKGEIVADKFSKNKPSVNDMMAGIKKNKDLASYLKAGPIKDLKKAIKLNDRIWYINELFNKNASTFEKTVDVLNKLENLDQALEYIFTNFNWDQNRKSTISFLELVFRRFATT